MGEFVAYYRVSTERQRVSGPGLEAQRETGTIHPLIAKSRDERGTASHDHGDSSEFMIGPPAFDSNRAASITESKLSSLSAALP